MDANEDGFAISVSDGGADRQGDKNITASGHPRADAVLFEVVLKAQCGVEREVFFIDKTIPGTLVMSTVTGVDDDVAEAFCMKAEGKKGDE